MITCTFEDGGGARLRHVTVDVLVVDKDKKNILLVKRAPHLYSPNKYCFPGGYLGRDEFIKDAAVREVLEETGYEVKLETLFSINDNPVRGAEDRQNVEFLYIAVAQKKVSQPDDEASHIQWFSLDNTPAKEEFAFNHYENLQLYKKYLKNSFPLPLISGPLSHI